MTIWSNEIETAVDPRVRNYFAINTRFGVKIRLIFAVDKVNDRIPAEKVKPNPSETYSCDKSHTFSLSSLSWLLNSKVLLTILMQKS